jgi:hypothetical protein
VSIAERNKPKPKASCTIATTYFIAHPLLECAPITPSLTRSQATSHIERQNLTVRMSMRRMTRLTNAFSKKWLNLKWAYALQFAHYNFCRPHTSLEKSTPAMVAGIAKHVWSIQELITA